MVAVLLENGKATPDIAVISKTFTTTAWRGSLQRLHAADELVVPKQDAEVSIWRCVKRSLVANRAVFRAFSRSTPSTMPHAMPLSKVRICSCQLAGTGRQPAIGSVAITTVPVGKPPSLDFILTAAQTLGTTV
jgi:hypothetical protein